MARTVSNIPSRTYLRVGRPPCEVTDIQRDVRIGLLRNLVIGAAPGGALAALRPRRAAGPHVPGAVCDRKIAS
eukprot:8446687-Pyramimonas_sp.AAC.2